MQQKSSLARLRLIALCATAAAERNMGLFQSKPKAACLLDIDGTLALTDPLYVKAFQDLMAAEGVKGVDEAWFAEHVAGKVDSVVFKNVLPGAVDDARANAASKEKDRASARVLRVTAAPSSPVYRPSSPRAARRTSRAAQSRTRSAAAARPY